MIEIDLNSVEIPLDPAVIFGREAPLHLEIGSGKGRFSVEFALAHPEVNYLSVERAPKYHAILAERVARRKVENIRLLRTTAEDLIFRLLPGESVDAMYILFPDPWPKKRHHKRRLINGENLQRFREILKPGAQLLIKSDHPDYAEVIAERLAELDGFESLDASGVFSHLPQTGFEMKYIREGRDIHAFALRKITSDLAS